jgi:hypothetical protein
MDDSTVSASAKIGVAWVGVVVGGVTLSNIALVLTIAFTILQIWRLVRNEIRDRKARAAASVAFAEKITAPPSDAPPGA